MLFEYFLSTFLRNYQLSQKLKLLGYGEFNHLTNINSNSPPHV